MSTGSTSTAPVVMATLEDALAAEPELAGVQVLYGDTAKADRENLIITGNIHWADESWAALGARSREETYTVDGYCQVRRPGDTQQAALERSFELVAVVENTLRQLVQPGMGFSTALNAAFGAAKAQVTNVEFKPGKGVGFPNANEGKAYQLDFEIRITARI
jgi:hypothetical protein